MICTSVASQVHKAAEDDLDMSEREPMFLKDKGDAMHKAGNHRAALNAYTKALKLDASLTACYCNRAVVHLKLQDYRHAVIDCCCCCYVHRCSQSHQCIVVYACASLSYLCQANLSPHLQFFRLSDASLMNPITG